MTDPCSIIGATVSVVLVVAGFVLLLGPWTLVLDPEFIADLILAVCLIAACWLWLG